MNDKLIQAAKDFLLVYFSDGLEHRPGDFDDDILGGVDTMLFVSMRPRWNDTPFFEALTQLVEEGIIEFNKDENGYKYWLSKTLHVV